MKSLHQRIRAYRRANHLWRRANWAAAVLLSIGAVATALPLHAAQAGAAPSTAETQSKTVAIDPAKLADIQRLFEVSGSRKNVRELLGGVLNNMKPQMARGLPPGPRSEQFLDAFLVKFRALVDSDDFFLHLAQIYDNYFTREDLQALIQFYQTPAGQRFAAVMPQMTQEFGRATQQWIAGRVPKLMQELSEEYPELRPGAPLR